MYKVWNYIWNCMSIELDEKTSLLLKRASTCTQPAWQTFF